MALNYLSKQKFKVQEFKRSMSSPTLSLEPFDGLRACSLTLNDIDLITFSERNSIHEFERKDRHHRNWRDTDGSAWQQTWRAAQINRGISRVGRAPCHGRRRPQEEGFRRPGAGRHLYNEPLSALLA